MRRILSIVLIMFCFCVSRGQEFRCTVQVNSQKLMTTTQAYSSDSDKKLFDNMKQAIEDFINGRRWSNIDFQPVEKIDCSIALILNSRVSATEFGSQVQIQMRRPVYNSTYTTGLLNYMESGTFNFTYTDGQPLDFDMNNYFGNLSSMLGYYCYLMLGMYFDSFAPGGGAPFYQMAQMVQQAAEAGGASGWNSSDSKNRYWFMENHVNGAYAGLHNAYYLYHRQGLDMMTKDQAAARQAIIGALESLQQVSKVRPNLLSVQQFVDVKVQELISIFTPAPAEERQRVYDLVKDVSPINAVKMKDINTKK